VGAFETGHARDFSIKYCLYNRDESLKILTVLLQGCIACMQEMLEFTDSIDYLIPVLTDPDAFYDRLASVKNR
jgi:hypothetical protein